MTEAIPPASTLFNIRDGRASARPAAVILTVRCTHCDGAIQLECEGLQGVAGYETYNEFFCPHCRKQNFAKTAGAIAAVRVPLR